MSLTDTIPVFVLEVVLFFISTASSTAWSVGQASRLSINISADNNFTVSVKGQEWFHSGPIEVRNKGRWLSPNNGSLIFKRDYSSFGVDILGTYNDLYFEYQGEPDPQFRFTTLVRVYEDIDAIIFGHRFDSGAEGAATVSPDSVVSSFPSFLVEDSPIERGYVTFEREYMAIVHVGQWNSKSEITTGMDGGLPLTVFDKAMENTIVISPFREFMATSSHLDTSSNPRVLQLGVFGKADQIPAGYSVEFIMMAGDTVTGTLQQWGQLLRTYYGKDDSYRKADFSINYLGYWTDDGACYYAFDSDFDLEKTLIAVKEQADKDGIPYRYMQIDTVWYYKGIEGATETWEPRPTVLPDGVAGLSQKTDCRIVAQNTWWSANTSYAKQNGGSFDFIIEPEISLPNDPLLWEYLFSTAVEEDWNLVTYEQDSFTFQANILALQSNVTLGRSWLVDMGNAAQKHGLTIQYCDQWMRHVMQSVEIPAVTQTRVSADYMPGGENWIIGDATIIAHALGLAAFKDTFHTIGLEKHCVVYFKNDEFYPELEATVAAFSGGPVGPSDRYNLYNKTLIMATCMEDGLLLKPTRPVMSLDSSFTQRAFGYGGPKGQLWTSYTMYENAPDWYFIFAAMMLEEYTLTTNELPLFNEKVSNGIIYQSLIGSGTITYIGHFNATNPLKVPVCRQQDFQIWTVAPVTNSSSWVFLGETTKIVKMSEQRVSRYIITDQGYLIIQLHGSPQEIVTMAAIDTNNDITVENVKYFQCTIPGDGKITLHIPAGQCQYN